jgi:hypothetical protein
VKPLLTFSVPAEAAQVQAKPEGCDHLWIGYFTHQGDGNGEMQMSRSIVWCHASIVGLEWPWLARFCSIVCFGAATHDSCACQHEWKTAFGIG